MKSVKVIFCCLCMAFFMLPALAQPEAALFNAANQAYAKANYAGAIEKYEKLTAQGFASAELFFNLGNAYYKNKNYPKAILYFEKAVKLNPNDEDAIFNLKLANKMKVDKIEALPELFTQRIYDQVLGLMSPNHWALTTCIFIWLALIALAFLMLSRNATYRRIGLLLSIFCMLICLLTFGISYLAKKSAEANKYAILMSSAVYVKSAPEISGADLFLLHEGTKLKVLDEINGWRKVKLADGKTGWLEEASMEDI